LHRNDAYQVQNIGGRMRAIADMPPGHEMQTISTILKCIAQGNIEGADHEPDEEPRIFTAEGMSPLPGANLHY
jgi:hypothetical protein